MLISGRPCYFCSKILAMDLNNRIRAFSKLGNLLGEFTGKYKNNKTLTQKEFIWLDEQVHQAMDKNAWFTLPHIMEALSSIAHQLSEKMLRQWTGQYPNLEASGGEPQTIGVVPAGNIPLVGFHDFLSILIAGHHYYAKPSSKDSVLPKALASLLKWIEPGFQDRIRFEERHLHGFDAVIATGSNNTARYFHYYFGRYPSIIRKNRNGVAVLTGRESSGELRLLARDVLLYFGLGCRNVSKLYLPEGYNVNNLLDHFDDFENITDNSKYGNNYDYHKSVFLINQVPHYDTGFLLMKKDPQIPSPISTLHYEHYSNIGEAKEKTRLHGDQIQCIVSHSQEIPGAVPFGEAQHPRVWDYADNIDTLRFLTSLNQKDT